MNMKNFFSRLSLVFRDVRFFCFIVLLSINTSWGQSQTTSVNNLNSPNSGIVNSNFKSKSINAVTQPILRLQISNGTSADEAIVYSNPGASNGYDAYDSPKMFNASASMPEIYTVAGGEQLAINGLYSITYDIEYPLGLLILNATVSSYTLRASEFVNFPVGAKLLLKDKLDSNNPVITDMTSGNSYSFSSGAVNYSTSRFAVIFKSPDPSITTSGSLTAVNTTYGTASSFTSFTASGTFLTNNIVITAPSGYEISKTSGGASGYAASQTLTQSGGVVAQTTLYIRLAATTIAGSYSGNVSCVSSGATTVNLATVPGSVSTKELTISGLTGVSKPYNGTNSATFTGTAAFTGLVNSESFEVTGTPVATFADELVGTGKTITVSGFTAPNSNYTVTQPTLTADITSISTTISSSGSIGSSALLPGTDLTVQSGVLLDVDNNATVHSIVVNPGGKVSLESGKSLTVQTLTLQSDANGTATWVDNGGTLNAGTTNVQQYLTAGRNWYLSSPVSAATSAVFSPTAQKPVYFYDEVHGTDAPWTLITDASTTLTVMKGYVATKASDGIVTFTGTLNTGTQTINVSRTAGQDKEGFNLIGNPYPSYLDWDLITKTHVTSTLWYRTKTAANAYTFDTYNSTAHLGITNGTKMVTNLIPPMQAFWVRVDTGQSQATISVDNSKRTHADNSNNGFKLKSINNQPIVRMQLSNGMNSDETIIYSNPNALNGYDNFDSPKMFNNSASIAEIFTIAGNEELSINGFNTIPYDTEIPLGFSTLISGSYSFNVSQISNFDSGTQLILKDYLYANNPVVTDLTDGSSYSFSSDASSINISRFTLTFKAPSLTTGINPISSGCWISTNGNGQLMINGTTTSETVVAVYNTVGQKLFSETLTTNSNSMLGQFAAGVYMVSVTNAGKCVTTKVVVK